MKISKWGNSLAVRLAEGDEIEFHVVDRNDFGVVRKPSRKELVERLHAFHGLMPADLKFDREAANSR